MKEKVYPIQIHFKGKSLDDRSVPIYELGESLIAIQRIVQRAYLIVSENDQQKSIHRVSTRENLALQIVRQEKGSDVYILDWFMKAVAAIPPGVIEKTLELLFSAGVTFVTEQVIGRNGLNRKASLLLNDYLVLSNRIGTVGKIEEIEIYVKNKKDPIIISKKMKEYISHIREETITKRDLSFIGAVTTVHVTSRQFVDVLPDKFAHRVKVTVANSDDFDMILETSAKNKKANYRFNGFTQIKPGEDPVFFETFIATEITIYKGKKKSTSLLRKKKSKNIGKPKTKKSTKQPLKKIQIK